MTTNDTRTARERAEEASAKWRPWKDAEVEHRAFLHGYLARDAEVMPVDKLYVKRDAEPTTVTAEQIEAAERRGAIKALREASADLIRFRDGLYADICQYIEIRADRIEGGSA